MGPARHLVRRQRFGYVPDLITTAKGMTSAYAPMGAVIVSERVAAPFLEQEASFPHGLTFGGHPVSAAVALANIDLIEREDLLGHVRENEPRCATRSSSCATSRSSATCAAPATSGASSSSPTARPGAVRAGRAKEVVAVLDHEISAAG